MKRAITAALVASLITASFFATVGFGASNSKSKSKKSKKADTTQTQTQTGPPPTMGEMQAKMEAQRAANDKKVADAIGVSVDDLTKAIASVKKKNLDQAVTDNKLTAAERDAIIACDAAPLTCDRTNLPAGRFGGFDGPGHGIKGAGDTFAKDLAAALNVDVAKVTAALKSVRPTPPAGGPGFRHGDHGHFGHGPGGPGFGDGPAGAAVIQPAPAGAPA